MHKRSTTTPAAPSPDTTMSAAKTTSAAGANGAGRAFPDRVTHGPAVVVLTALLLILAYVVLWMKSNDVNDLFWQIRAGRDIAATGHVPGVDTYSWTRYGKPWISPEWLSYLPLWYIYRSGGIAGIWLYYGLLTAVMALFLWAVTLRATRSPWLALVWAMLAGQAFHTLIQPRPYLYTYVFFPIFLYIVRLVRRSPRHWKLLFLLPPFTVLWTNLHQAALAGVTLILFYAAGTCINAVLSKDEVEKKEGFRTAGRLFATAAACLLATFVNPFGWRYHQDALSTIGNAALLGHIQEWMPVHKLSQANFTWLYAYLAILAAALATARVKPDPLDALLLVVLLFQGETHVRHVALFVLASVVLLPDVVAAAARRLEGGGATDTGMADGNTLIRRAAIPTAALICIALMIRGIGPELDEAARHSGNMVERVSNVAFEMDRNPVASCRFIREEWFPRSLRLYNSYGIGGYLILATPEYPVFIDGRSNLYFGGVLEDYWNAADPVAFDATLDRYGADLAIVTKPSEEQALFRNPKWALVYEDAITAYGRPVLRSLVFLRRRQDLMPLIEKSRRDAGLQ